MNDYHARRLDWERHRSKPAAESGWDALLGFLGAVGCIVVAGSAMVLYAALWALGFCIFIAAGFWAVNFLRHILL